MSCPSLITGKKRAPKHLGRVLVLGLGRSGRAMVAYCLRLLGERVDSLAIAAGQHSASADAFAAEASERGASVAFGDNAVAALAADVAGGRFDCGIPSPGIPPFSPLYAGSAALCDELVSEVEFAWRESDARSRWVAVTGTNGKTTVASLAAHLLRTAGVRAAAVGNIGDTCIEAVMEGRTETYVAEVSSYQLASTSLFAPQVAVLLNITPDHLHWHGTFEAYRSAKLKVMENLAAVPGSVAVMDATNDIVRSEVRRLHSLPPGRRGFTYVPLGDARGMCGDMRMSCGSDNAAFFGEDGVMRVAFGLQDHELVDVRDLRIKGAHNSMNALAAATVALALGADDESVAQGLRTFLPLEHRIEPCGSIGGVACYNDSKATNSDATIKALSSFPGKQTIVLLGGQDKGCDLAPLIEAAHTQAQGVVCFGAAAGRFAAAFERSALCAPDGFKQVTAAHLEEALDAALVLAEPGDVVLLSPACASFDEFASFEQRGDVFKSLVAERAARRGA